MKSTRRTFIKTVAAGTIGAAALKPIHLEANTRDTFVSAWPEEIERPWVGPEFWANRLQDWRISGGRLECVLADAEWPMRTVHLLTRQLSYRPGKFTITVRSGLVGEGGAASADAATGLLVGAGGGKMDYRGAALIHSTPGAGAGIFCGVTPDGKTFIRKFSAPLQQRPNQAPVKMTKEILLRLEATPSGENMVLKLSAIAPATNEVLSSSVLEDVSAAELAGNIAMVSHPGSGRQPASFWFRDLMVAGDKIVVNEKQGCGPVLSALYTVHNGILKLTAQLMPIGAGDNPSAELQIRDKGRWRTISKAKISQPSCVARFRVEQWDAKREVPYRVVYDLKTAGGKTQQHIWEGKITRDPVGKEELVLASLSCVQQVDGGFARSKMYAWPDRVWFPHADMVPKVAAHKPDLYFFAGDQIYEGNPTPPDRSGARSSELDYLYKWYLWCWSYGDLVRDTPCICIPDDHDAYHPNIWGVGGQPAAPGDATGAKGGFVMPPAWVNMMQETQCSNLPDPFDPTPAKQGIGVYYTSLIWGGVGFAILEDRKFKSPPTLVKAEMTVDSHITEKGYDTRKADVPGAQLLGERQLKFLREFARDWRGQKMKAALSQTIFCNLQISSRGATAGELDKDLDSGGWPQSGRNAALDEMRRGFMIHIAGDQHLASTLQHGIEEFDDANWSICSPAISNTYVRYWNPDYPPVDGQSLGQPFSGRYEDGFHNKITIHAVANPVDQPAPGQFPEPVNLYRKGTGYNIIRFNKADRTILVETWPRHVDPTNRKTGQQYPGWPIKIAQTENYGRRAKAFLPTLKITGVNEPVVQIVEESSGEVVYTLRLKESSIRPKVFAEGLYTVNVSDPERGKSKMVKGIMASAGGPVKMLEVKL